MTLGWTTDTPVLPKPLSPLIDSGNELTISVPGVTIHSNTSWAILSPALTTKSSSPWFMKITFIGPRLSSSTTPAAISIECLSASPDLGAIRPYGPDGTKIAISVEIACLV